jgi:hypothetical protein
MHAHRHTYANMLLQHQNLHVWLHSSCSLTSSTLLSDCLSTVASWISCCNRLTCRRRDSVIDRFNNLVIICTWRKSSTEKQHSALRYCCFLMIKGASRSTFWRSFTWRLIAPACPAPLFVVIDESWKGQDLWNQPEQNKVGPRTMLLLIHHEPHKTPIKKVDTILVSAKKCMLSSDPSNHCNRSRRFAGYVRHVLYKVGQTGEAACIIRTSALDRSTRCSSICAILTAASRSASAREACVL